MQTRSAVEKAVKEIRHKKVTDDDVPADILELLREDGLRIVTQVINHLHETGQWHENFSEVVMFALKNKMKDSKCSDHCKIKF